jgi:hypothetical protein
MSKWRVGRVRKPTPRLATIVIGAAMGIAAAVALPHAHAGDADCSLFQARLETSEHPALELHVCAMVPSTGGALVVRYDVAVRIAVTPNSPR